jgi:hypothetical protein
MSHHLTDATRVTIRSRARNATRNANFCVQRMRSQEPAELMGLPESCLETERTTRRRVCRWANAGRPRALRYFPRVGFPEPHAAASPAPEPQRNPAIIFWQERHASHRARPRRHVSSQGAGGETSPCGCGRRATCHGRQSSRAPAPFAVDYVLRQVRINAHGRIA